MRPAIITRRFLAQLSPDDARRGFFAEDVRSRMAGGRPTSVPIAGRSFVHQSDGRIWRWRPIGGPLAGGLRGGGGLVQRATCSLRAGAGGACDAIRP